MPWTGLALNLVFLSALLWTGSRLHRYRRFVRSAFPVVTYPIPEVRFEEFEPLFTVDELGPTLATETHFVGTGDGVPFGTSDLEAWVLAVLAKRALRMFEFGTATGKTAYLWARNSADDASVTTLTLAPDQVERYRAAPQDSEAGTDTAKVESAFTRFFYSDTPVEGKVRQLFGDSKELDEARYGGQFDLIFVDGSHAYSYVKSDSEKALRMVCEGGAILWHDYRGPDGPTGDVYRYLNELSNSLPLVRLKGTTLVAYRADGAQG